MHVKQLYSEELKTFLEDHLTLVYSGQTRMSGMNNWEVYKAFFNKDKATRDGLTKIAELSNRAFDSIEKKQWPMLLELISEEGRQRKTLFPGIETPAMGQVLADLTKTNSQIGMKVCGAGGGGCFSPYTSKRSQRKSYRYCKKDILCKLLIFQLRLLCYNKIDG